MRESRQPQNILRQEKLGGIAGIILGVLGLILIFQPIIIPNRKLYLDEIDQIAYR